MFLYREDTFSRTTYLATVLDQSEIGLRNINESLTCFHDQLSPLIFNPIEHLGKDVERSLRILETPLFNMTQIRAALISEWANISQKRHKQIFECMPRKIEAVIRDKGEPTRY